MTFPDASSEDVVPEDVDIVLHPAAVNAAITNAARILLMVIIAASHFRFPLESATPEPQAELHGESLED
ncbi:MAG: hypothetical protein ACRENK_06320 [Gemmatimonadaceae bacterium]